MGKIFRHRRGFNLLLSAMMIVVTCNLGALATTATGEQIMSENFDALAGLDAYDGLFKFAFNGGDIDLINDSTLNSRVLILKDLSSADGKLPYWYYNTQVNLTGNIVMEGKFNFNKTATGTTYLPITFAPNAPSLANNIYSLEKMLYVRDGAIYSKGANRPGDITWDNNNPDEVKVCDIQANKWYTMKVIVNVDGNTATFDTFNYYVSDGVNTYIGGPYPIGQPINPYGNHTYDLTSIGNLVFGAIDDGTNASAASPTTIMIDDLKVYYATAPTVTSSVIDGATGVAVDGDITLTFDQPMNESSISNIKLLNAVGVEVSATKTLSTDKLTCVVSPGSSLGGLTAYKILVPTSVISESAVGMTAETTINFTTGEGPFDSKIMSENFDTLAGGNVTEGLFTFAFNGGDIDLINDPILNSRVLILKDQSSADGKLPYWYYTQQVNLTGNIVMEGKFNFNKTAIGTTYLPLTFAPNSANNNIYSLEKMLYVRDGAVYSKGANRPSDITYENNNPDEVKVCDIQANKWYTMKVILNVDGNATTYDTFNYNVSDGVNTYIGGPYPIGQPINLYGNHTYDLTSIGNLVFGAIDDGANASAASPTTIMMDDLKVYYATAPTVTSSVIDGATGVAVDGDITLIFDQQMNESTLSNIRIYEGTEAAGVNVYPLTCTLSTDGQTVTLNAKLKYAKTHAIVIPNTVSSIDGLAVNATSISFTTEAMPVALAISDILLNNGSALDLTAGKRVTVSAKFTNIGIKSEQQASLIVALFDSTGTMKAVAFANKGLTLNASETIETSFSVPNDIGVGAYIKLFAWDDFEFMTPMSPAYKYPEN